MFPQLVILFCACVVGLEAESKNNIPPYSFHVVLEIFDGIRSKGFCSGAIISNNLVITGGACVRDREVQLGRLFVKAGITHASATEQKYLQRRQVLSIHFPQKFDGPALSPYNIAVLKLKEPWAFNRYVNAIVLPKKNRTPSGTTVVIGWATQGPTVDETDETAADFAKIVNNTECSDIYTMTKGHVCLDIRNPNCARDNGGPVAQIINDLPTLVAVHTYQDRPCSEQHDVGVNVAEHIDWIKSFGNFGPDYDEY